MNSRFDDTARKYREEMLKLYRNSSQFRPEPPTPVAPKQNPPEPPCSKEVQRMEFRKEEIKKDFPIRKNTGRLPTAPPPDDNEIIAVQGEIYENSRPDNIPAPNNNIPPSAEEKYPRKIATAHRRDKYSAPRWPPEWRTVLFHNRSAHCRCRCFSDGQTR